ncbi:MAG: hypothetical protein ACR2JC_21020 [Chloroflexota bacterium]
MSCLREDFWATTSNKQLNFLQHARSLLEINGRAVGVPWTRTLWVYDLRANQSFTLKTRQLTRADLDDFVTHYNPENRHERVETDRFRPFSYEDLVARDKSRWTSSA